jgi:secreted Zn-dependent insulinase-like peptidase
LKDVQQFIQRFVQNAHTDVLVYGNFYQEEAQKLGGIIRSVVGVSNEAGNKMPLLVAALKPAEQPVLYVDAMAHNDATLVKYFQAPADDTVQQVDMLMLDQVLASPFFDSLRTEQQLGYIVGARYLPLVRVPGLAFLVQSPSHGIAEINARADAFIKQYFSVIDKKDDAWFEQQKRAVMVQLQEKPKNQPDQAEQFFDDLILGYTAFDSRAQKVAVLQKMTRRDLLNAYRTVLLAPERRELLLVSPGKTGIQSWLDGEARLFQRVEDVDAF